MPLGMSINDNNQIKRAADMLSENQSACDEAETIRENRGVAADRVPFAQLQNNISMNAPAAGHHNRKSSITSASQSLVIPKDRVTLSDHFKAVKIDSLQATLQEDKVEMGAKESLTPVCGPHLGQMGQPHHQSRTVQHKTGKIIMNKT